MARSLSGTLKQIFSDVINLSLSIIIGASGLAAATPLLFSQTAYAASGNDLYVSSSAGDDRHTCLDSANPCRTLYKAIENSSDGDIIHADAGTYTLTSTLGIDKSVSIEGAGTGTVIDASGVTSGYGVYANVNNVTIEDLSIIGPANSSGYGLKIEGSGTDVSATASNITVSDVSVSGSYRTGIDLNGINGATLTNVSASGTLHGNGIALTDSRNVTINGATTFANAWGGIALYATGGYFSCGVDNVTLTGANSLGDLAALYTGIDNPSNPDCTVSNLHFSAADLPYKVTLNNNDPRDIYVTNASAANLLAIVYAPFSPTATTTTNGAYWVGSNFKIQNAIDSAADDSIINVDAGTFDSFSVNGKTNLTINGAGAGSTTIAPTTLISSGIQHKYTSNMQVSVLVNNSTGITIQGMTIKDNGSAPGYGGPDALVFWNASTGTLDSDNITGTYTINGIQSGQGIAVDASGSSSVNLAVRNTNISGFQKNGIDAINGNGATTGATGTVNVSVTGGSIQGAGSTSAIAQNGIVLWDRAGGTVTGSVDGTTISDFMYSPLNIANGDYATGILTYGNSSSVSITNSSFKNNDISVANATTSGTADAAHNYWDSASPDFGSAVLGDVLYTPYYTDSGLTTLSQSDISANNIGSLIGSGTNDILQLSGDQKTITVQQDTNISVPGGTHQSSVMLPAGTQITQTNGDTINTSDITASTPSTGSFTSLGANKVAKGALQWGIPGIHLSFSQPITASIYVGTALDGQTLDIVHSANGTSSWTSSGIVSPATCLVTSGYCTFQATEASYYVATKNVTPSSGGGSPATPPAAASAGATENSGGTSSSDNGNSEVLGENSAGTPQTMSTRTSEPSPQTPLAAAATTKSGKILGLTWYYWLIGLMVLAAASWLAYAYRHVEN